MDATGEPMTAKPSREGDKARQRVLNQLDIWRKELINLARSNRLLYFKHTRSSTLEIVCESDEAAEVVERLLGGGGWNFFFPPDTEDREDGDQFFPEEVVPPVPGPDELITSKKEGQALRNSLRLLERRATQEFMDKGIWVLYLAAGMLHWIEPDTQEAADSPLVLIPVELSRENPREPYELRRADEDIVLNPALEVKLGEFGIKLPSFSNVEESDDLDLNEILAQVNQAVTKRAGWEVQRRLVIGPFSFHKEVMYRDLLRNQDEVAGHAVVQALALGAEEHPGLDFEPIEEAELDDKAPPEDVITILDADATQRQCIAAAEAGASFVMDGPPGTGKSQTISNMIAELLEKGRTVLFVSEKAAALEVVQKRLHAAGLGDYTLELHSHKATRKEVAQHLGASLELYPRRRSAMPQTALKRLLRRRHELSRRAEAMNEVRQPLGRTLLQAIGRVAQLQNLPQAPLPAEIDSTLSSEQLARLLVLAEEIARAWGPVARADGFLWRDLKDPRLDSTRQQRTTDQVEAARLALGLARQLATETAEELLLPSPNNLQSAEIFVRIARHLEARPSFREHWLTAETLEPMEHRLAEVEKLHGIYHDMEAALQTALGDPWRNADPAAAKRVDTATDAIAALALSFELQADTPISELRPLNDFLGRSPTTLAAVLRDARVIAGAFGMSTSSISLARAADLADLGSLAAESARPEGNWINAGVIEAVGQAVEALEPLVSSFSERREELGSVFTDEVLALDLETLCARFAKVHTGLSRLRGAYRADKRTVAGATRTGKATKEAISLLPTALQWQELNRELERTERQHAGLLGAHYYQRTESDFQALRRALENARRGLVIAGRDLNVQAMRRQVARKMTPDPQVPVAAQHLRELIEPWRAQATQMLDGFADLLLSAELEAASAWCGDVAPRIGEIAEEAMRLAQLSAQPLSVGEVRRLLEARALAESIDKSISSGLAEDQALFGSTYVGLGTDWNGLRNAIEWTTKLRTLLGGDVPSSTAARLQEVCPDVTELDAALSEWYRRRDDVVENFEEPHADEMRNDLDTLFADADELLGTLQDTVGDIDEWIEHVRAQRGLRELGMGEVIEFCVRHRTPADDTPHIVDRACLERWIDSVMEEDSDRLQYLRADQLDPIVEEFRKLDLELIESAAGRVVEACNARRPRTTVGAAGIIKREAAKQRRHMPVRKLLEATGEVAQALKPCFMMSPLTVSQFLPPSLKFGAVIFDEASQVRPSDAINCVYRGGQLIVAGDDKQLPPTSFFEAVSIDGDDEWEEDQFDEFESILELAKGSGGFRELPLKWHYRSQHEDLITYSNQSFYDGRLTTFPGAASEGDDLGVRFFHVPDGVYRRGTSRDNPRESERVVERIIHWAQWGLRHPDEALTVGVVAFSEAQAACIEIELERRRRALPELDGFFGEDRLDGFFIKNLENVQGDERDVMIFSVGYGRDENGKLTMNFGPLNRAGGRRRLNVAITRARRRVEVVSSIEAGDFKGEIAEGARHLQRYLDYAARGPQALALEIGDSALDVESPFEEEVVRAIRSWGYDVQPQVGTAGYRVDIGVRHPSKPGRFVLGVECDGWMYHSSRVARDRDRLRQEVLERLGWRIYRIWGTAWYRNRRQQEKRLREAIDEAIEGGAFRPAPARRLETPAWDDTGTYEAVSLDEAPSWTIPYEVAQPKGPRTGYLQMHDPQAAADLRRLIMEVVRVEGPVQDEVVLRRVREAWGVGRAGSRIREAFQRAIGNLTRRGELKKIDKVFLAKHADQLSAVRVPGDDAQARRDVEEVPKAELRLAVVHLVDDARRVSRDELSREVARLFGWNRRGPDISRALDRAVDALIREGSIDKDGDYLHPV